MYNHVLYLFYWGSNILTLLLANVLFPQDVVLGNYRFNGFESAIYAAFWVTVIYWSFWGFVYVKKVIIEELKGKFLVFWAFNFVSFWLVSRFSHIAGFGISSFWWVIVVSFVANILQRLCWKFVTGRGANINYAT